MEARTTSVANDTPTTTFDIFGSGFDPNPAGNDVQLNSRSSSSGGGNCTVVAAHPTKLRLNCSSQQALNLGPLLARVTSFGDTFGGTSEEVQVAMVRPRPSVFADASRKLAGSATQLVIAGSGFDASGNVTAGNAIVFSPAILGAAVSAATATSLTVTFFPSSSLLSLPGGAPLSVTSVTSFGLLSEDTSVEPI